MSNISYSSSSSSYASKGVSLSENLAPKTLARVGKEVRDLIKNPPEGCKLMVDPDTGLPYSLNEIMAEVCGPEGTPYDGRYFHLKLVIPSDFPNSPPRGFFLTKIYHPNVDPSTGAICVNTLKKDWSPMVTMSHVLGVIRCLLIVPFPESSLNDEAGKLFMESYDEYAHRARLMANIHGKLKSVDDSKGESSTNNSEFEANNSTNSTSSSSSSTLQPSSPKCKENEGDPHMMNRFNATHVSPSDVLKQSNGTDRNNGTLDKKVKATKKIGDVKKKKNLMRL